MSKLMNVLMIDVRRDTYFVRSYSHALRAFMKTQRREDMYFIRQNI